MLCQKSDIFASSSTYRQPPVSQPLSIFHSADYAHRRRYVFGNISIYDLTLPSSFTLWFDSDLIFSNQLVSPRPKTACNKMFGAANHQKANSAKISFNRFSHQAVEIEFHGHQRFIKIRTVMVWIWLCREFDSHVRMRELEMIPFARLALHWARMHWIPICDTNRQNRDSIYFPIRIFCAPCEHGR